MNSLAFSLENFRKRFEHLQLQVNNCEIRKSLVLLFHGESFQEFNFQNDTLTKKK